MKKLILALCLLSSALVHAQTHKTDNSGKIIDTLVKELATLECPAGIFLTREAGFEGKDVRNAMMSFLNSENVLNEMDQKVRAANKNLTVFLAPISLAEFYKVTFRNTQNSTYFVITNNTSSIIVTLSHSSNFLCEKM